MLKQQSSTVWHRYVLLGVLTLFAFPTTLSAFWQADGVRLALTPLCTLAIMSVVVLLAASSVQQPATRQLDQPSTFAFQVLTLSATTLSSAAIAFGWYPLPLAGSLIELAHCVLPVLMVPVDACVLRWLNPVQPNKKCLPEIYFPLANYRAAHGSLVSAAIAFLGVFWYENPLRN